MSADVQPWGAFPREQFPVLFEEFLASHEGRLVICSGVVTQIERHVQVMEAHCPSPELRAAFRAKFWALVQRGLNRYRIDEKTVTLGNLEESLVARYGPVDASIILLAATARTGDRHVVVTDDRPLAGVCRRRQTPVQSVDSILEWMSGRSSTPQPRGLRGSVGVASRTARPSRAIRPSASRAARVR
jgi:hypothetical protein